MHLTAVNSTMPARILQALVPAEHNTNTGPRFVCKKNFVLLLLIAKKRQKSSWIFTLKLFKQVVQGAEIRAILQLSCSTIALVRMCTIHTNCHKERKLHISYASSSIFWYMQRGWVGILSKAVKQPQDRVDRQGQIWRWGRGVQFRYFYLVWKCFCRLTTKG